MIEVSRSISPQRLETAMRKVLLTLPLKVGETVVNFSLQRFREQAWVGYTSRPWPARKAGAARNKGRNLLVDSGRLRRSIRILRTTSDSVTTGSDVPYAGVHNEGFRGTVNVAEHSRNRYKTARVAVAGKTTKAGNHSYRRETSVSSTHTVKAHTRHSAMPERRFLGESPYLNRQLHRMVAAELQKAIK